jgi:hypothetical protein
MIVGGLTDLGMALYISIATKNAVREGVRVAASTPGLGENDPNIHTAVANKIPDFSQFPANQLKVSNTAPTGTTSTCDGNVTVSATGNYSFMVLKYIGFTDMTISQSATMRYESGRPLCT